MIPLDGRQEDLFYLGVDEFMQIVGANWIFPMHFWEDFSVISRLKALPCSAPYRACIVDLEKRTTTYKPDKADKTEVNQLSRRIEEEGLSPESPVPALV